MDQSRSTRSLRLAVGGLTVAASLLTACISAQTAGSPYARTDDAALTATYGTKQLTASGPDAFAAVRAGLEAQGYVVAIANIDRGLIRTAPKPVAVSAHAVSRDEARQVERTFQIVAQLTPVDGRVKVALTVRHYRNNVDVTAKELVRKTYLVEQWQQIFGAVYDALPARRAAPASPGRVL